MSNNFIKDINRRVAEQITKNMSIPDIPLVKEIEMIYQTDKELNPEINEFGCCFMSLLWLIDNKKKLGIYTHEGVLALFKQAKADKVLGDDCWLASPQGLCDYFEHAGKIMYKGWARRDYICTEHEMEQLVFKWDEENFTHFGAGDGNGNLVYDSINYDGQGSNTVKNGYLESKRIYQWI